MPEAGPGSNRAESPNILLVTGSLQAGGAERVMADMANYWSARGWKVTLATWSGPEVADFYALEPSVQRAWLDVHAPKGMIFGKLKSNILRVCRLRRFLAVLKPRAVLSFIDTSNVLTIMAAIGLRMPVIVSERIHPAHYFGIGWQWRVLRRVLYSRADVVVAQTRDAAVWLAEKCRVRAEVIQNHLRQLPELQNPRESLILAVGRLSRQKGFDLLLQAFAKICGEFDLWRLVIIGSGPEQSALLKLTDDLNLRGRVEFRQPVKDVESWMSRAGLVVQPSRFEGFPNVLLEAMGMGAAVVSTDCPAGPSEIIQDGVNGRLVPVEDVDALAHTMADLLRRPVARQKLGAEAIKVRERYRQDKVMAQWERCILNQSSIQASTR